MFHWDRGPPGPPYEHERTWRSAVPLGRRALLAAAALAPALARAQAPWPSQPLKIVVPYPPGGLTDVLGRLSAERLQTVFGQPVIVDNKPGAATQLGASYVAKQPPDGYTLLLATVSTLCITPALYTKPLTTYSDFAPVAFMGNVVLFLVCRPGLEAHDPRELVALLRAKPGGYSYGSPGIGSAHHLLTELILSREQLKAVHVPYLGSVKAVVDLAEGRIDFMFLDATVALPQVAAGKIRALAVTGTSSDPTLPEVPPIVKFFAGLDLQPWMSFVAPASTPSAAVEKLNGVLNKALVDPPFIQRLRESGMAPLPLTVAAFGDFIKRDSGRWAELVKISGAKAE
jgi:tripartite-type tricarboxylate transporter receptor subunit TctC